MVISENIHTHKKKIQCKNKIKPVTVSKVDLNSAKQQPNNVHPSSFRTGRAAPVYSRVRCSSFTIACNPCFENTSVDNICRTEFSLTGSLETGFVKAGHRPWPAAGHLLFEGFVQGSRGRGQKDAPCGLGDVGGGHVDH